MTLLVDKLCELARRLHPGRALTAGEMPRQLQSGLAHVIHRALRTGGASIVARWLVGRLGIQPGSCQAAASDPHELASLMWKEITCHLPSDSPRSIDPLSPVAPLRDPGSETVVEGWRPEWPCRP